MLKGQPAVTLKRPAVLPAEKAQRLLKSSPRRNWHVLIRDAFVAAVGWMLQCAVVTRHA